VNRKTITPNERLQLIGLLTLADQAERKLRELRLAVAELLGVDKDSDEFIDVIGDMIWSGGSDADAMLRELKIGMTESEADATP
jgi:hypothetical protein